MGAPGDAEYVPNEGDYVVRVVSQVGWTEEIEMFGICESEIKDAHVHSP